MKTMSREMRFRIRSLRLVVAGLLFLAWHQSASAETESGWRERWNQVLSEAKKEGKIVVLGPPGELIREAITQGFSKAFSDIGIEYLGGRGGEQAARLKVEREGGIYRADVFLGGPIAAITQVKPIGAQDPVHSALILPEVADPKYWRGGRLDFSDKEGLYNLVFVNQLKTPLIFDPKRVKAKEVDELYKLLRPQWKGRIVINDPLPSGAGHLIFHWIWQVLGPEKAKEYFRKIRAQAGAVDRDQRRQIEWIAQGKYAMVLGPSDGVLHQLLQLGVRVGVVSEFKDYGTPITASFGSVSLLNRAPHPNAAKVFINWLLGKDGQTAWSKATDNVSRRIDVPTNHLPPYQIPKPSGKYWSGYKEGDVERSPEEEKILKELFGR